ncbi:hypothetical protein KSD_01290 [Ktedonobacter sp. SOSP1-85]|uniref:tetratricopeptide repeat protein n=1 Tax=Ktedonobacter sp. SOSP1-85 TaxID=2778367 RepID=UPI00191502EB|nr:tetratricopeptide repeat protein [Ktedonobacter sp. SOSP1-85]GHO72358.1 hypothetical protein KSD_01290 [Ktedonobacter sp. SOSP1-85]
MSDKQKTPSSTKKSAGQHLREEREMRGWSQQYVAEQLGADRYYLSRWENGKMLPSPYYREKLCALFGKNARELGLLSQETPLEMDTLEPESIALGSSDDPAIPPPPDESRALIGRQTLLSLLKSRLCSNTPSMVLALYGLPGVGKTALAIALAHDTEMRAYFHDGILWAGAGKNPDVIGILRRWSTLLGISATEASRLTTREAWAQAVRTSIGSGRILLIMDDIWTLEAFASLKVGGNSCVYLVTTRFPQLAWHTAANNAFLVSELDTSHSITLLERLAPLAIQQEPAAAAEIARLVGGLPLALLLTGNFLRVQTYNGQQRRIRQAIERLRSVEMRLHLQEPQAFAERSPSMTDTPAISLHTLIAISDQQVEQEAREALYTLSVFPAKPNTFSEAAALAVCQRPAEVLDTLCDAGLLESYAPDRYALHQTIADYASLQRRDAASVERFANFMAEYVNLSEKDYQRLEQESSNIQAALRLASEHNHPGALIAAGNAFAYFLFIRGSYTEAVDLLEHVCQAATAMQNQQSLATALYQLGDITINMGEYARAYDYLQRGLTLTSELDAPALRSCFLRVLGICASSQGDYAQAESHLQEALALARQGKDDELMSLVLRSMGGIANDQGKFAQAEEYLQEGLVLARRVGKPDHTCALLINLGQIALTRAHYAQAEKIIKEGLDLAIQIGFRAGMCLFQQHLGIAAMEQGKYALAREPFEQSLALARRLENREYQVSTLANLGLLFLKQSDYIQAEAYLAEGLRIARILGNPWALAGTLNEWGKLCLEQGKVADAAAAFIEMYQLSAQNSQECEALALYGQARVAHIQGDMQKAHQLGQASLVLLQGMEHYQVPEIEQWLATVVPM